MDKTNSIRGFKREFLEKIPIKINGKKEKGREPPLKPTPLESLKTPYV